MNKQGLFLSAIFLAGVLSTYGWLNTTATPDPAPPVPVVSPNQPPRPKPPQAAEQPVIRLAIMLDTSNSMDGLIDQARAQLWKIVNEFAKANHDGKPPRLEVTLYEFGNDGLSPEKHYVRQVVAPTTELDAISEALFALRTNGGEEYCGAVLQAGLNQIEWSKRKGDLNMVFIAGNEGFNQGPVDFHKVCGEARQRGILVNTIYCGNPDDPDAQGWSQGATLAEGRFMTIDQNQQLVHIQAPQDQELARLSSQLNDSYIPYGASGEQRYNRQRAEDEKAAGISSEVASYRAMSKSSAQYDNASWDLVDAHKKGQVNYDKLKREELPEPMRDMDAGERQAYVEEKQKEREEIQAKIQKLNAEREAYVAEQRGQQEGTLDAAVTTTVREQAEKKGYQFQ